MALPRVKMQYSPSWQVDRYMAISTCDSQALGVAKLAQHFLRGISSLALGAGQEARGSKEQKGSPFWQLVVWL